MSIQSKPSNSAYRDGWDRVFGNKEKQLDGVRSSDFCLHLSYDYSGKCFDCGYQVFTRKDDIPVKYDCLGKSECVCYGCALRGGNYSPTVITSSSDKNKLECALCHQEIVVRKPE